MLSIALVGNDKLMARFQAMPGRVRSALAVKLLELAFRLQRKIQTEALSGQVLNKRTGNLQSSIFVGPLRQTEHSIVASVFVGKDVPYAAIHEYGGTINHPGGTAFVVTKAGVFFVSNAKAALLEATQKRQLPRTQPHKIIMPQRSYMRSSLKEMKAEIIDGMREAALGAMR